SPCGPRTAEPSGFLAWDTPPPSASAGAPPQFLANASRGRGGAWNADGTILFPPNIAGPLVRVAASGGDPAAVTRLDSPGQTSHRFPQFLPDGRRFIFFAFVNPDPSGVYLESLNGVKQKRLT